MTGPQKPSSATRSSTRPTWGRLLCQVDWTCLFFIVALGIATGLVKQQLPAAQRPVYLGDAAIAFPHKSNTVQTWQAALVPAVLLLSSAAVIEFLLHTRQGARQAWLMLVNTVLAMLAALAVTLFLTELFKRICGRLRPDYLDRCRPTAALTAGANPVPYGTYPNVACTAAASSKLMRDGRMSFPSGHSSCAMVVSMFGALYVLWAVHCRANRDALGPLTACREGRVCMWAWLRVELLRLGVMLVVLFFIAWPWGVGASRFVDNRHNVSDIIAGLMLGACFAPLFLARLVWHSSGWAAVQQQEEAVGEPSAALPVAQARVTGSELRGPSDSHSVVMVNVH